MQIDTLIATYTRAQAFAVAAESVEQAKYELDNAYCQWKRRHGISTLIANGDVAWCAMMDATKPEYRELANAKARERWAQKKLLAAVEEV